METYRVSSSRQCCATCEYWGALRLAYRYDVETEEWGICSNRKTSRYGQETKYRDSCSRYLKWIVLEFER